MPIITPAMRPRAPSLTLCQRSCPRTPSNPSNPANSSPPSAHRRLQPPLAGSAPDSTYIQFDKTPAGQDIPVYTPVADQYATGASRFSVSGPPRRHLHEDRRLGR